MTPTRPEFVTYKNYVVTASWWNTTERINITRVYARLSRAPVLALKYIGELDWRLDLSIMYALLK